MYLVGVLPVVSPRRTVVGTAVHKSVSEARGTTNTQTLNAVPNSFRHDERRWSSALIK